MLSRSSNKDITVFSGKPKDIMTLAMRIQQSRDSMKKMDTVYYATFSGNEGDFLLAATDKGLCWANRNQEGFDIWLKKYKADSTLEKNADKLRPYWAAYEQYL